MILPGILEQRSSGSTDITFSLDKISCFTQFKARTYDDAHSTRIFSLNDQISFALSNLSNLELDDAAGVAAFGNCVTVREESDAYLNNFSMVSTLFNNTVAESKLYRDGTLVESSTGSTISDSINSGQIYILNRDDETKSAPLDIAGFVLYKDLKDTNRSNIETELQAEPSDALGVYPNNLVLGFWLKRIKDAYSGFCCRVYRSSDSVLADVDFDPNSNYKVSLDSSITIVSGSSSASNLGEFSGSSGYSDPDSLGGLTEVRVDGMYDQGENGFDFITNGRPILIDSSDGLLLQGSQPVMRSDRTESDIILKTNV